MQNIVTLLKPSLQARKIIFKTLELFFQIIQKVIQHIYSMSGGDSELFPKSLLELELRWTWFSHALRISRQFSKSSVSIHFLLFKHIFYKLLDIPFYIEYKALLQNYIAFIETGSLPSSQLTPKKGPMTCEGKIPGTTLCSFMDMEKPFHENLFYFYLCVYKLITLFKCNIDYLITKL